MTVGEALFSWESLPVWDSKPSIIRPGSGDAVRLSIYHGVVMNRFIVNLSVAAFALAVAFPSTNSQDSAATKRTFLLRAVPNPADPDPATQTIPQRTATLRKRMAEAKALLDAGKMEQCFEEYIDPFWLARAAAGSGGTVGELLEKQILGDKQSTQRMAAAFATTIESNLNAEPKWLINGRVASFMTGRSSHTAEFWIYFEGKWRISPET